MLPRFEIEAVPKCCDVDPSVVHWISIEALWFVLRLAFLV